MVEDQKKKKKYRRISSTAGFIIFSNIKITELQKAKTSQNVSFCRDQALDHS